MTGKLHKRFTSATDSPSPWSFPFVRFIRPGRAGQGRSPPIKICRSLETACRRARGTRFAVRPDTYIGLRRKRACGHLWRFYGLRLFLAHGPPCLLPAHGPPWLQDGHGLRLGCSPGTVAAGLARPRPGWAAGPPWACLRPWSGLGCGLSSPLQSIPHGDSLRLPSSGWACSSSSCGWAIVRLARPRPPWRAAGLGWAAAGHGDGLGRSGQGMESSRAGLRTGCSCNPAAIAGRAGQGKSAHCVEFIDVFGTTAAHGNRQIRLYVARHQLLGGCQYPSPSQWVLKSECAKPLNSLRFRQTSPVQIRLQSARRQLVGGFRPPLSGPVGFKTATPSGPVVFDSAPPSGPVETKNPLRSNRIQNRRPPSGPVGLKIVVDT